jgi:hypothetical protein
MIGAPAAPMTEHIVRFAADICQWYGSDVILYRAGTGPVNVRTQLGCRFHPRRVSPAQSARWARFADGRTRRPRIFLVDSSALDDIGPYELAPYLRIQDLRGYSLLILDDWRTYIDQAEPMTVIDPQPTVGMQRFATSTLSAFQRLSYRFFACERGLSLAFALIQSPRGNPPSTLATRAVEAALLQNPDRRVILHNFDLCVATSASTRDNRKGFWALLSGGAEHRPHVTVD